MFRKQDWFLAKLTFLATLWFATLAGAVSIDMVTVGNPGNPGELSGYGAGGYATDRICGAVDYTFQIGKFEVTAAQYAEFLNAVARTDTYGLWSPNNTYSVPAGSENRPVNYVSWGDAARFANWLTNGKPTGPQTFSTTEDGSYYLNGATTPEQLLAVARKPDALYVIPTEDEWYKAAYHKNNGPTGDYWDYPTASDVMPGNVLPDVTGNNANHWTSPYPRPTLTGAYVNSMSPYGTFDQGGNMYEWNEAILYDSLRGVRGGSFFSMGGEMRAAYRNMNNPDGESYGIGFRVVLVPEPAGLWLVCAACLLAGRRGKITRLR